MLLRGISLVAQTSPFQGEVTGSIPVSRSIMKTILITGASSGFGKATAELLAKDGHNLILIARRLERLKELQKILNTQTYLAQVDITQREQVERFFNEIPEEFINIDVLVNNAGLARGLDLAQDAHLDDWEEMINTNIKGVTYVTRLTLEIMKQRKSGHIVNIGSVSAIAPYPKGNVYGATKAFVRQFSRNLRTDLIGTNIRVSNIEPGAAETEFSLVRFKGDQEKANAVYENARMLKPEDIANTIKWIIDQPLHINIDNVEIMPIDQTYAGLTTYRSTQ